MKRAFLLIAVPALLVALGFAQTPATSTTTDQTNVKGCLGGWDGNYTVVEDNTGHIFKISTSSVDLKPHLGHDVALIGHSASEASSATAANGFAVTELNMISEHCAAAAAAPAATVATPAEPAVPPAAAAPPTATVSPLPETTVTPADATPPAQTGVTPAADATPPAAAVTTPAEPAVTTAPSAAAPAATVTPPAAPEVTPAVDAAPVAIVSTPSKTAGTPTAHPRRRSQTPAAAATTPTTASSTSSEPDSAPAAVATTPAAASKGWSLWLWIAFAVLVIVLGTLAPFLSRWRKRKNLERTGAPNLSFTHTAKSDPGKRDPPVTRKAA